jgi:hypothetical protein
MLGIRVVTVYSHLPGLMPSAAPAGIATAIKNPATSFMFIPTPSIAVQVYSPTLVHRHMSGKQPERQI